MPAEDLSILQLPSEPNPLGTDVVVGVSGGRTVKIPIQGLAAAVADKNYVHDQGPASAIWTVVHGLGKYPAIQCFEDTGTLNAVGCAVRHDSVNQATLMFNSAISGKAVCN